MRVVFPAVLDGFECGDGDCACREALRSAAATKGAPAGQFPFRDTEKAVLRGAARLAAGSGAVAKPASVVGDYPIAAVATPTGAELYFSTLCPMVRAYVVAAEEAVDLARSEGGWRAALQVFQPAPPLKAVLLAGSSVMPWKSFQRMRDQLLDINADTTHSLLARMARAAHLVDQVITELAVPTQPALLTPRAFLAFRAHMEERMAVADAKVLAAFVGKAAPLFPDLDLDGDQLRMFAKALAEDWREPLRLWVAPSEQLANLPLEAFLALRYFAIPLARDQSLERGYAELQEGFAVGLRFASALGRTVGQILQPEQMVACLALGDALVADAGKPLPLFMRPVDSHDRGPRMADLDMTLESLG